MNAQSLWVQRAAFRPFGDASVATSSSPVGAGNLLWRQRGEATFPSSPQGGGRFRFS